MPLSLARAVKTRFLKLWDDIRSSYWFIPLLMALGAIVLSFVVTAIDGYVGTDWIEDVGWLYGNKPEGARALLSTIAGSMITVAGVVFSITVAAVVYASGQYGPRLLTNFMRDRGSKVTLGTFIATFLYCILVLRTVRAADEMPQGETPASDVLGAFVPHVAILTAVGLALASIVVLIYFIHHIPQSIHVSHVIAEIGEVLAARIDELFPERLGEPATPPHPGDAPAGLPDAFHEHAAPLTSTAVGYLQRLDEGVLLEAAGRYDLLLDLRYRPGDFVDDGSTLLLAWPAERLTDESARALRGAFATGRSRTAVQDVRFLVDELVEIAGRALSPGINDPFTAISCLQWLGNALQRLARRQLPGPRRYDADGRLRVVARPTTYADFVEAVFGQLRPYVAPDRNAAFHAIGVMGDVAGVLVDAKGPGDEGAEALRAEADALVRAGEEVLHPKDADEMRRRHRRVLDVLDGRTPHGVASADNTWLGGSA